MTYIKFSVNTVTISSPKGTVSVKVRPGFIGKVSYAAQESAAACYKAAIAHQA